MTTPRVYFKERARETGLDFEHDRGAFGSFHLAEITCGGGGFADIDGDGDLDVYLSQGGELDPMDSQGMSGSSSQSDRLYRNDLVPGGTLRFSDVTAGSGLAAARGYGCGVAAGDYDNDGHVDLLALNLGANQLWRNRGDGTFEDVTAETAAGLLADRSSVAASFFDYDRDGWLDLFVGNYLKFVYEDPPRCYDPTGAPDYCGPTAFPGEPNQLFHNLGRGAGGRVSFAEVTAELVPGVPADPTLGVVTADFDGDGWMDVYVANDGVPNRLWVNRHATSVGFTDEAVLAGCGVNASGAAEASMGVTAGDVDGDGDLDLFMTHLIRETNTLYVNDGQGFFADRTLGAGLGASSLAFTSFGTGFLDFDNDGRLDLLVVSGAVTKLQALAGRGDPFPLHQPNQLFRNVGSGDGETKLVDVTAQAGPAFELSEVSRGAAFGDVDNDGDTDVVVINNGGPARLLINEVGRDEPWLGLRLLAGEPPRDQPGARAAAIRDGEPVAWRHVRVDGSYSSTHDPRLLFGLGEDPDIDGVRVIWPDGTIEDRGDVEVGAYTILRRGRASGPTASGRAPPDREEIFVERSREAGLDFVHFNGMSGEHTIVEEMGSGGALFDYDNDGDLDLYLVQGRMLGRGKTIADAVFAPRHPLPLSDRLYRNELESGTLRFTDVTEESGLARLALGYGIGVAAGDYDNDGWIDLYLTQYGSNQLLRNQGRDAAGRVSFADLTAAAGVDDTRFSVPAVFFDYDRDGWLDLWVGNYVEFPLDDPPICRDATGARDYCGPNVFTPQGDRLFHNRGPGADGAVTFADVTEAAGLDAAFGPALGVVAADWNGDGRPDLYVANDGHPNHLWIQQGDATFVDEALLAGTAINAEGQAEASMGVDAADFDGDGDLDLFMTHFVTETNTLYLNDGQGLFRDATIASGLGPASRVYTSFGTGAIDYDRDGWEDLLVVSGAVNRIEALARRGDPFPLHQPNQLFRNLGGRFEEVTAAAGRAFELSEVSRGAIFGDVDNDGDSDVVVVNNSGPARLLINQAHPERHWVGVRLLGAAPTPRDLVGARAAVLRSGRPVLWRRVRLDGSYASASDPRLLFGLGEDPAIDGVRVVWPDGTVEDFTDVPVGAYTTLRPRR